MRRANASQTTADEAGDFEALFLDQYGALYRLVYRIVGGRQEAEDLVQETFLRFCRQRFNRNRSHNQRGWLYRVATNLAYNLVRDRQRQARQQEALAASRNGAVSETPPDPVAAALQREEQQRVRQVLMSLPERQSRLLLWRYAGLSYKELAEALAIAPGSVGTLLARAHAAFEAAYDEQVLRDERSGADDT